PDATHQLLGPGRDARHRSAVGVRTRWAAARRPARDPRWDGRGAPLDCREARVRGAGSRTAPTARIARVAAGAAAPAVSREPTPRPRRPQSPPARSAGASAPPRPAHRPAWGRSGSSLLLWWSDESRAARERLHPREGAPRAEPRTRRLQ